MTFTLPQQQQQSHFPHHKNTLSYNAISQCIGHIHVYTICIYTCIHYMHIYMYTLYAYIHVYTICSVHNAPSMTDGARPAWGSPMIHTVPPAPPAARWVESCCGSAWLWLPRGRPLPPGTVSRLPRFVGSSRMTLQGSAVIRYRVPRL